MAKILVVGGAGYVGSSVTARLLDAGHVVHVLDDLSTGHDYSLLTPHFTKARAGDRAVVLPLLERERFDCVMHFAACALVGESVTNPGKYFENNVEQTRRLVQAMLESETRNLVFSSTCAVFGVPQRPSLDESHPKAPVNPYGESKLAAEGLLSEFASREGLRAVVFRYFNAAGAEEGLRTGECHEPETHLIPNVFRAVESGNPLTVFGSDYETPDGTCVRDYVHVSDLADAHMAAMRRLKAPAKAGSFEAFNLGSQTGYSVLEVIHTAERILGRPVPYTLKDRRPGDPPRLVADATQARRELGFLARYDLKAILRSAWNWEQRRLERLRSVA